MSSIRLMNSGRKCFRNSSINSSDPAVESRSNTIAPIFEVHSDGKTHYRFDVRDDRHHPVNIVLADMFVNAGMFVREEDSEADWGGFTLVSEREQTSGDKHSFFKTWKHHDGR